MFVCTGCLREHASKLLACGRCKSAFYCGSACQADDWPRHREDCCSSSAGLPPARQEARVAAMEDWLEYVEDARARILAARGLGRRRRGRALGHLDQAEGEIRAAFASGKNVCRADERGKLHVCPFELLPPMELLPLALADARLHEDAARVRRWLDRVDSHVDRMLKRLEEADARGALGDGAGGVDEFGLMGGKTCA